MKKKLRLYAILFGRYIEGAGCYVIARELIKLGHKTKKGRLKWHESTIRWIINNEKYSRKHAFSSFCKCSFCGEH